MRFPIVNAKDSCHSSVEEDLALHAGVEHLPDSRHERRHLSEIAGTDCLAVHLQRAVVVASLHTRHHRPQPLQGGAAHLGQNDIRLK